MRRTVDVDHKLLREAQAVFGASTIKETVELGLREAVSRRRLEELRRSLGKFELDLTPEELQRLRDDIPCRHVGRDRSIAISKSQSGAPAEGGRSYRRGPRSYHRDGAAGALGGSRSEDEYKRLRAMVLALHPLEVHQDTWEDASCCAIMCWQEGGCKH